MLGTKEKVYDQIMYYLEISKNNFNGARITDLVYATISPILYASQRGRVYSYAEIVATDEGRGGYEEFVVVDLISVTEE